MEDFCIVKFTSYIQREIFLNNLEVYKNYHFRYLDRIDRKFIVIYRIEKYSRYFNIELFKSTISAIPEASLDLANQLNLHELFGLSVFTIHPDLLEGIDYEILCR